MSQVSAPIASRGSSGGSCGEFGRDATTPAAGAVVAPVADGAIKAASAIRFRPFERL
jgi:hypothetical protein